MAVILTNPPLRCGKVFELTGPRSEDMNAIGAEYSSALGRNVKYVDVPLEQWRDDELRNRNLPEHFDQHLPTMARLNAANRHDRLSCNVDKIAGHAAASMREFVARHVAPGPLIQQVR